MFLSANLLNNELESVIAYAEFRINSDHNHRYLVKREFIDSGVMLIEIPDLDVRFCVNVFEDSNKNVAFKVGVTKERDGEEYISKRDTFFSAKSAGRFISDEMNKEFGRLVGFFYKA